MTSTPWQGIPSPGHLGQLGHQAAGVVVATVVVVVVVVVVGLDVGGTSVSSTMLQQARPFLLINLSRRETEEPRQTSSVASIDSSRCTLQQIFLGRDATKGIPSSILWGTQEEPRIDIATTRNLIAKTLAKSLSWNSTWK